jgi:kynurenine 3-monooxygenase
MKNKITIAGAGLAGSLLSVYLAKKGFEVNVYERRPDMRKENAGAGKSINLALSTRGIHALKEVGLYDEIKKISIPMYGRMIHAQDGQLMFQRYGKDDTEYINAVSRAELNNSLMNLAEKNDNVKIFFNERCTGADFKNAEIFLHNEKTGVKNRV